MAGEVKRAVRVAGRIREELAKALQVDLADPRLERVIISRVEVTDDLQQARVWVRLTHDDDVEARRSALRGLRSASAMLRRLIGRSLELRRTPELRFEFDQGLDAQARIDELLDEIKRDQQ